MTKTQRFTGRTGDVDGPDSLAFVAVPLNLQTLPAVKVYQRHFAVVERSLYLASTVAFIVARQKQLKVEALDTTLTAIDAQVRAVEDALQQQIARLQQQIPNRAVENVHYTHPATGPAEYRTPQAGAFLRAIQQLDQACQVLHHAYFAGRLSASEKLEQEQTLQRLVTRLAGHINGQTRPVIKRILRGEEPDGTDPAPVPGDDVAMHEPHAEDREGEALQVLVQHHLSTEDTPGWSPKPVTANAE
jgi:hypothetical protein